MEATERGWKKRWWRLRTDEKTDVQHTQKTLETNKAVEACEKCWQEEKAVEAVKKKGGSPN